MIKDAKKAAFIIIANILKNKLKIIVVFLAVNNLFKCHYKHVQLAALNVKFYSFIHFLVVLKLNSYFKECYDECPDNYCKKYKFNSLILF